ncbi:hypothetical protein H8J72_15355, partial [Clostridium perfringens]|nr:hypothetical protein [Clostridium perfringens]
RDVFYEIEYDTIFSKSLICLFIPEDECNYFLGVLFPKTGDTIVAPADGELSLVKLTK